MATRFELSILPNPDKAQCLLDRKGIPVAKVYAIEVRIAPPEYLPSYPLLPARTT